jgi:polysaccharide biosynthesis protein PelF
VHIALTAEGTYPHQFGGVSVWCDQLVRGLPECDFSMVALVATGSEPVRWELPANLIDLTAIPLWGPSPPPPPGSRWLRPRSGPPVRELIEVLLAPPDEEQERFGDIMREMFAYSQYGNLSAALASEDSVRLLSEAWRYRWPDPDLAAPSLQDAVTAVQLLEHALRPLAHPPPRADVVHAVTNGLGALPALAAKWRYGTPIVVTEHGMYMREHYLHSRQEPFRWPVKQIYLQFLRRLCVLGYHEAAVITPGNVYNKRWEAQLGADLNRVRTVYNGVNPADFPAFDSEPEVPTISWAGRVDPIKDLESLLRAFAIVRRELPDARLRIFGSPPAGREAYLARCQALAKELKVAEAVTFEGRVPEIRDAYAAGQVVVLCSITEGFPYTLIEAMTCGRPCVATDVGGVTEAVGDTGLVVPPRRPAELARACLTLLRDKDMRNRLGAAARLRALEYFTVDRAISAFDEIYMFLGAGKPLPVAAAAEVPPTSAAVVQPGPPAGGSGGGQASGAAGPAVKPADVAAVEAGPAEALPAEARPAEARPAEARPAEALPAEALPAAAGPAGGQAGAVAEARAVKTETARTETVRAGTVQAETIKTGGVRAQAAETGVVQAETATAGGVKTESAMAQGIEPGAGQAGTVAAETAAPRLTSVPGEPAAAAVSAAESKSDPESGQAGSPPLEAAG